MASTASTVFLAFCSVLGLLFIQLSSARFEFNLYEETRLNDVKYFEEIWMKPIEKNKTALTNDSVTLYKYMNNEYYGTVGVGSPSRKFKFIFDTAWVHSWLPSSRCVLAEFACRMHDRYDNTKSSSYQKDGRTINITTSDYSLSGFFSMDNFHLDHIGIVNQTFIEMTHMSMNFMLQKADGVIGLGLPQNAQEFPFFSNMLKQNLVKKPIITIYMNSDETTNKAGKIIFGETLRKHAKNPLTVVPTANPNVWSIKIDSIFVGDSVTSFCNGCTAVIDTSNNAISGPKDKIMQINYLLNAKYIPFVEKYTVTCREYAKYPSVTFVIAGKNFTIHSKYYIQRLTYESLEACFSPFVISKDPTNWLIGGAFLMQFYTEYNYVNKTISISETLL